MFVCFGAFSEGVPLGEMMTTMLKPPVRCTHRTELLRWVRYFHFVRSGHSSHSLLRSIRYVRFFDEAFALNASYSGIWIPPDHCSRLARSFHIIRYFIYRNINFSQWTSETNASYSSKWIRLDHCFRFVHSFHLIRSLHSIRYICCSPLRHLNNSDGLYDSLGECCAVQRRQTRTW